MFGFEFPTTPTVEKMEKFYSETSNRELSSLEGEISTFETDQVVLLRQHGLENGIDEFIKTGSMRTPFLDASGFSVDIDSLKTNVKLSEEGLKEMAKEMRERIEEARKGEGKYTDEKVAALVIKFKKVMADALEQIQKAIEKKKKKDMEDTSESTV